MGRHLIDAGNLVGVGGQDTVLAEINRIDPIYVYFTINERDLLRVIGRGRRAERRRSGHDRANAGPVHGARQR